MSVEAITWALKQNVPNSSAKFVLVVMANCADAKTFESFPSVAYLSESTGQNRKTVITNIRRLSDLKLITDTGRRVGVTGGIKAYQINVEAVPKPGYLQVVPKAEPLPLKAVPKPEPLSDGKQSQKRTEAVPFLDISSPKNGQKQSQKRDTDTSLHDQDTSVHKNNDAYPNEFEQAWNAYPNRAGSNPKRSAYHCWNARITGGANPEEIRQGVIRYAAFVRHTGKEGTEYVKQAKAFFGPDEHFKEPWKLPAGKKPAMAHTGFERIDYSIGINEDGSF